MIKLLLDPSSMIPKSVATVRNVPVDAAYSFFIDLYINSPPGNVSCVIVTGDNIPAVSAECNAMITMMADITRNCFRRCGESPGSFIVSSW